MQLDFSVKDHKKDVKQFSLNLSSSRILFIVGQYAGSSTGVRSYFSYDGIYCKDEKNIDHQSTLAFLDYHGTDKEKDLVLGFIDSMNSYPPAPVHSKLFDIISQMDRENALVVQHSVDNYLSRVGVKPDICLYGQSDQFVCYSCESIGEGALITITDSLRACPSCGGDLYPSVVPMDKEDVRRQDINAINRFVGGGIDAVFMIGLPEILASLVVRLNLLGNQGVPIININDRPYEKYRIKYESGCDVNTFFKSVVLKE